MEEEPSPMELALRNPVVLQQILQYSVIPRMEIRLVCKLWNEVFLSLPEPKQVLNLNTTKADEDGNGCCDSRPFQLLCCDMEPKLARCIKVSGHCPSPKNPKCHSNSKSPAAIAAGAMLIQVCDKFGDLIQYIDLDVEDSLMYKILKKSTFCENLKTLVIRDCETYSKEREPLPIKPKLVSLHLRIKYNTCPPPCDLIQLIINSAPNLQKLELSGANYFPNLSGSHQLRTLIIPNGVELKNFRFPKFYRMLVQVAERLEVLKIGCDDLIGLVQNWDFKGSVAKSKFQFPSCLRLKRLVNHFVGIFPCGDALEELNTERFPSLKHLYLGNCPYKNMNLLLSTVLENQTQLNATSLHWEGVDNVSLLASLRTSFPHLKQLKLDLMPNEPGSSEYPYLIRIGALLSAVTTLGLSHLEVVLKIFPTTLPQYLKSFLDNSALFQTLRTISMVWNEDFDTQGRLSYNPLKNMKEGWDLMRDFLLVFARMENAIVFLPVPKDDWWRRVSQFIQDNKLPVQLKWRKKVKKKGKK